MSARAALKSATRSAHERLDAHFSRYDLSSKGGYAAFLSAHAAAYLPVEQALTRSGIGRLLPCWEEMRRGHLLVEDVREMGMALPSPVPAPELDGDAALLGAAYVLEGSRLGGKLLGPAVGAGFPARFLSHRSPMRWGEFVAILEDNLYPSGRMDLAVDAARATFGAFFDAARVCASGDE
ncbi:biliverdin-producing heme oxygenase [Sphingomicrobium lutaoense]|uniref:Heme oxygenase n=1 Tax=Sphingomicrobium lutaoense TaxID=515949 RepID=A0A839Z0K2_9SPHN|nr:biliverdin-producing heme oxygenase [Sphingomicrobium lutaoense]MBB3764078.1 heme oxygenase [Sphingomicrobium lutaoense]